MVETKMITEIEQIQQDINKLIKKRQQQKKVIKIALKQARMDKMTKKISIDESSKNKKLLFCGECGKQMEDEERCVGCNMVLCRECRHLADEKGTVLCGGCYKDDEVS